MRAREERSGLDVTASTTVRALAVNLPIYQPSQCQSNSTFWTALTAPYLTQGQRPKFATLVGALES